MEKIGCRRCNVVCMYFTSGMSTRALAFRNRHQGLRNAMYGISGIYDKKNPDSVPIISYLNLYSFDGLSGVWTR